MRVENWLERETREVLRVMDYDLFGAGLYNFQNSNWTSKVSALYSMLFIPKFKKIPWDFPMHLNFSKYYFEKKTANSVG